jgi:hypothetical protein
MWTSIYIIYIMSCAISFSPCSQYVLVVLCGGGGGEIWKANTGEMVAQVGQHQHAEEETHEDARDGGLSQR